MKISREPIDKIDGAIGGDLLYPCPVVLVSCVDKKERPNIITLSWVGIACSRPPIIGIGVLNIKRFKFSYNLIKQTKEFVVNIPSAGILQEVDYIGEVSGKDHDKFMETELTPQNATKVKPPLIKECPVNLECKLKQIVKLGSHNLILGRVVYVHVDQDILNETGGKNYKKANPILYCHGEYWSLGEKLGRRHLSRKTNLFIKNST